MNDIAFWPASRLVRALRARKIGALELLEHYAARGATSGRQDHDTFARLIEREYHAFTPPPAYLQ